jgi:hypothetical protein
MSFVPQPYLNGLIKNNDYPSVKDAAEILKPFCTVSPKRFTIQRGKDLVMGGLIQKIG